MVAAVLFAGNPALAQNIWDSSANYSVQTSYNNSTKIALEDYLTDTGLETTYTLVGCDTDFEDYYDSVGLGTDADEGQLVAKANSKGHVHSSSLEERTNCTVKATRGAQSEDQVFTLWIPRPGPRTPLPMAPLVVVETSSSTVTVRVTRATYPWVRLRIAETGGRFRFYVVKQVGPNTDLTFTELRPSTTYQIDAQQMTWPAFHLWGGMDSTPDGTLVAATVPEQKWLINLGRTLGKASPRLLATTDPDPDPTRDPDPEPVPALPLVGQLLLALLLMASGAPLLRAARRL